MLMSAIFYNAGIQSTIPFDPIIERSPGLREKVQRVPFRDKPLWSSAIKRIGEAYYFFRGSWVTWKAQSIDADILVVDELDFQKPEIRKMYEERLEGSDSEDIIYWIGYPSLPSYGISDLYQKSDQREWWIECPHCKKWQTLTWPESISRQKKTYVCKICRKDLADEIRKRGKWIAKFPGRPIHGYAMSKLMAAWIPASKIIKSFVEDSPKHFHNYTLGLPFRDKKNELTDQVLSGVTIGHELWKTLKTEHVVCGIDQGDQFHFIAGVIGPNSAVVTEAEILKSPEEVEKKLDFYKPELTVIDMRPDKHIAKLIQTKYGLDNFYLGNLRDWGDASDVRVHYEVKRGKGIVNIERTESLDFLFQTIKDSYLKFRDTTPFLEEVFQHLKNLIPDYQLRYGKVRKVWKKVGKDDYAHAINFFLVGCQILFPGRELLETKLILPESKASVMPGSKEWVNEHFEKTILKIANPTGTIVIPPKNYIRK